jgi:hypothetical protein
MDTATQVDVEQELATLCGVLNQTHGRLVVIVAEALADESWAIAGIRSPEHWLMMRAGLSRHNAGQIVAVARRCAELPTVMAEFARGQLSLDQVVMVARYTPAHVEASVAELAIHASVPQLGRCLSRYSFDPPAPNGYEQGTTTFPAKPGDPGTGDASAHGASSRDTVNDDTSTPDAPTDDSGTGSRERGTGEGPVGDGDTANAGSGADVPGATWNGFALVPGRAGAPAELSMSHDQWGRFTLRFSAPADLGALVLAALTEAKDALFRAGRPNVTWADALIEIATRSLCGVESINRRDAYRTYVHLDTEGAWLTGQPRLPAHLASKLTCDGILQPVWHTQGAPVNVGRAQRIVPSRTRRLVEDRDRGCRYPGCATTTHVECHHLVHWADGGSTDTANLACLCTFHHDTHHSGEFTVEGDADRANGLTFTTRHGFPIHSGPTFVTSITSCPQQPPRSPGSQGSPGSPVPRDSRSSSDTPGWSSTGSKEAPDWPSASHSPVVLGSLGPPGSLGSSGAPSWPSAPDSPSAPEQGTSPSRSRVPPVVTYRGPSGDTLNLRWVTFHEPPKVACV